MSKVNFTDNNHPGSLDTSEDSYCFITVLNMKYRAYRISTEFKLQCIKLMTGYKTNDRV